VIQPRPDPNVSFCLYQDGVGGAETHTVALATMLAGHGWSVNVIFLVGPEGRLAERLRANGVGVHLLRYRLAREALASPQRLVRSVSSGEVPIVVLPSNGFLPIALRLGRYRGIVLAMEHGDALNTHLLSPPRRLWDRLDRRLGCAFVDCEVAVSETSRHNLLTLPHARNVTVIHNGVDMTRFSVSTGDSETCSSACDVTFGVAARLVASKGLSTVLDACAAVPGGSLGSERWRVVIAGAGPDQGNLDRQMHALGLKERVTFVGGIADMPGFWRRVDVGVFPSSAWVESFGLSSVEAAACGCRVLTSESAASREILGGCPTVKFFRAGDAQALSRCLVEAVRQGPPTAGERVESHSWVAQRYSLEQAANGYAALFSALRAGAVARSAGGVRVNS
jgi:glycosyltransferase involved in cell wall biosynthesis